MLPYKKFIDEKLRLIADCRDVLDVGGGKPFTKWMRKYEKHFANSQYRTLDLDESTGAGIIGDIHSIPLQNEQIDAIICSSVLEHVNDPGKAVKEMHRILKNNGRLFVYVPSIYPYHARKGHYPDYWRFFDDTIALLFKDFKKIEICKRGGYFTALSFFIPGQQHMRGFLDYSAYLLDKIFRTVERKVTTSGYFIYLIK